MRAELHPSALQHAAWLDQVAVRLSLDLDGIASEDAPVAFNVLIPRYSYINSHIGAIVEYFRAFALESADQYFLISNGIAIPFHYLPTGVLSDMFFCCHPHCAWNLTVSFRLTDSVKSHVDPSAMMLESNRAFYHSIKQALTILVGSSRGFNEMAREQHARLWESLSQRHHESYQETIAPLLATSRKAIPLRIVRSNGSFIQRAVRYANDSKITMEAGAVLRSIMGEDFSVNVLLVCGIPLPSHADIGELWNTFRSQDLFLYLVARSDE